MNPREIVRASAGAGKTFRISSRIIGLLASDQPPSSILASTFTRKAAGEILDRVLVRVADAVLDETKARELGEQTLGTTQPEGVTTDTIFWARVLDRIVAELGMLEVSTLDSFFSRVLRAFSNEMGLLPGWTIADQPTGEGLRSEALEVLFDRQDDGILVELVRALHPGEVRRSIYARLIEDIDQIVAADREVASDAPGWGAMRASLPKLPDDVARRAAELAEQVEAAEVPLTKAGKPNANWSKAIARMAEQLRAEAWVDLVSAGLPSKVLTAESGEDLAYYRAPFPDELLTLVEEAIDLARSVLGHGLAVRADALSRLAKLYDGTYLERLRSRGTLRFDDVTRLVAGWGAGEDTAPAGRPDFFWRLGSRSRHVLLDEFQDTSLLQWRALTPILDRLTGSDAELSGAEAEHAEPGAAVIVADPKQSIYGWRGAAPAVVDAAGERYLLKEENLSVSWRSSPDVLHVVNRVFTDIHDRSVLLEDLDDADTAAQWGEAFTPHAAADREESPFPGRVRVWAGPELLTRRNAQPAYFSWVSEHVARLHEEMPGLSIGVLTRTNLTVGQIILELGERGVPASQEGGTPLGDSPAIASIFALLRLADHPTDRLARYHVARTPLGPLVDLTDADDAGAALAVSQHIRRSLLDDGYGPFLSGLAQRLEEACDARERVRLQHLVELGYGWDRSPQGESLRVSDFLARALSESVETSGDEPVRVMTVHQSKGLEFDIVVLPELHGASFGGGRGGSGPISYRPDPTSPATHLFPQVSKALVPLFDRIEELGKGRRQARAAAVRDSLGMLYVAMTRARYALELVVPADPPEDGKKKPSKARTHARLLRECLGVTPDEGLIVEGDLVWQHPKEPRPEGWWQGLVQVDAGPSALPAALPDRIALATNRPRTRQLERTSPSSKEGGTRVDLRFLLGLTDLGGGARARGTLVHAWLEHLVWIEDGLPDEDALLSLARRHTPELSAERVRDHLDWTRAKLEAPQVVAALSRASAADGAEALAEVPFLVRDGGALMEGIIDRLVLTRDGDRVISAAILDYKTDVAAPGDEEALNARVEHYRPQIDAYRRAVASLYELDPADVSGALIFLDPGEVRSL